MDTVTRARERGLVVLRVVLGFGFFYAGLEKLLNFAGDEKPWSAFGFLKFATGGSIPNMTGFTDPMSHNPTQGFWAALAGDPTALGIVDFMVVFGELAIGIALILGIATRLAGILGALMMFLFWIAAWDFQYGIVNQQFIYMILSAFVAYASAGRVAGLDGILEKTDLARRTPSLRFVIG